MLRASLLAFALTLPFTASAESPEEWITLGTRVHGGFGSFIPLGIKIGLDAVHRLNAKPRTLTVLYYDSDSSPCAAWEDQHRFGRAGNWTTCRLRASGVDMVQVPLFKMMCADHPGCLEPAN
jgi:hypothetical protein